MITRLIHTAFCFLIAACIVSCDGSCPKGEYSCGPADSEVIMTEMQQEEITEDTIYKQQPPQMCCPCAALSIEIQCNIEACREWTAIDCCEMFGSGCDVESQ